MLIQVNDGTPGGAESVAALYTRHYPAIYAYAYRRTGDHARAEDVAAQTFVQALQALPRYQERGVPLGAWLARIAANVLISQARRGGREVPLGDQPLPEQRDGDPGPEEWVERWERAVWLRGHMATLCADQRHALWLRYGEDRALEEVAARLDRSPAATKQLLHRGVKALRERLQYGDHATPYEAVLLHQRSSHMRRSCLLIHAVTRSCGRLRMVSQ